jgi:hypothetical protein
MLKKLISTAITLTLVLSMCAFSGFRGIPVKAAASYLDLANYWAPEVYQDVSAFYGYNADCITNFDYDGDWEGINNWENQDSYPLHAYAYYYVAETTTNYFIGYTYFHTRDIGPTPMDCHENDMEGVLLSIKKDGSDYGQFQLMETLSHDQWYQYTNDPNITTGMDNVDGGVLFDGSHPEIFIQPNGESPWGGHGILAYDGSSAPGGDGIVYYAGSTADVPTNFSGYQNRYSYQLKSIDEFWSRRYNYGDNTTFASFGVLRGDNYMSNSAKLPWAWDDASDGATFIGECISDPAFMIDTHLNGLGNFSHTYIYNKYYTYKFNVTSVTSLANRDPFGGKSDIYAKCMVNGNQFTDSRLWKYDNATIGTAYNVNWGYNTADDGMQYSEAFHTKYVVMEHNLPISIQVMDSDDGDDDDMGTLSVASMTAGQVVNWSGATTSNGDAKLTASVTANTDY